MPGLEVAACWVGAPMHEWLRSSRDLSSVRVPRSRDRTPKHDRSVASRRPATAFRAQRRRTPVQVMRTLLVAAVLAAPFDIAHAADLSGAGATFPYPIYAKWADEYKKQTNIGLNYQSIGSGGGIKQIEAKTVTFGASDMPLKPDDLDKNGLIQFPTVMGGVVPVVNIAGIKPGEIVIDGPTVAKIYLGEISKWNDPAIQKLNPNAKL